MKKMSNLLPISVTIARIQAMQKGPSFPCLTNKKDKKELDPEKKKEIEARLKVLVNSVSVPHSFPSLKDALKEMRNEIEGKNINLKK